MTRTVMIYVELLDEGVDVWRPVEAEPVMGGLYRVIGPVPEDETWTFWPGSIVRCETRTLSGDFGQSEQCLVAVECPKVG